MPIVECTDYIVPQTVTAAPTITEGGGNGSGGDDEPIAPAGTLSDKFIMLTAIIAPFVGLVVAMALLGRYGWMGWLYLGLFLGGWTLTGRGVTIGFHRLLTHYSFETYRPLRAMWMILGALSVEGSPLVWCAVHRKHHEKSDHRGDPHSPHLHGEGLWNSLKGFWFSHAGWLLTGHWSYPNLQRYVPDLLRDKLLVGIDRVYYVWVILSLAIPTAIGGLGTFSWYGALLGLLWGGLVRICIGHHITWSVNSVCHMFGRREFRTTDRSTNNLIVGVLAWGEGWHNNHHAFPTSARHGLAWWQLDPSWLLIRLMEKLGLVWDVRVPSTAAMAAKRLLK